MSRPEAESSGSRRPVSTPSDDHFPITPTPTGRSEIDGTDRRSARQGARHPARFTSTIVDALAALLDLPTNVERFVVHDPMAGTGERLGVLADRLGLTFTGTEIEPTFIVDRRVVVGDATDPTTYPLDPHVIVTSPPYPNGVADHFAATDSSRRHTYRSAIATIEGRDRPLDERNLARYGFRGRGESSRARATYWRLAREVVECWWTDRAIVNVKDFRVGATVEPVVDGWADVLVDAGFVIVERVVVPTPGQRFGANGDVRVDHEVVLDAHRPLLRRSAPEDYDPARAALYEKLVEESGPRPTPPRCTCDRCAAARRWRTA